MQVFSLPEALQHAAAVTHLHLDRSGLKEVPPEVLRCTQLRVLNLRDNQVLELPDWLPQLAKLEALDVSGNNLRKWAADWSGWSSLQSLDLSRNRLTTIRGARLPVDLQNLNLSHNRLRTLAVTHLPTNLLRIDVSNNSLKQLPDMRACEHLRQLHAQKNLLADWPALPSSDKHLAGLQVLSLAQNRLTGVPKSIQGCQALRELDLRGNQLQRLPAEMGQLKWLVRLSLGNNQIKRIPAVLDQLTILDQLSLAENQMEGSIDLSANSQLRRLDLSKNPIREIRVLPGSLRHLRLKGLALQDWSFLRKQTKLRSLDLPAQTSEELLQAVCHLSELESLRGLLPYGKKEKLLRLLGEAFSPPEKRALLDFWVLGKKIDTDPLLLQKTLLSEIPALRKQARRQLLKPTEGQGIPPDTRAIYCLGRLQTSDVELRSLFTTRGIIQTGKAKTAILGQAPYSNFQSEGPYHWYSEAQLLAFLRKQGPKASSWTKEELGKLKKRLLHTNPSQVKLALLLMEKEALPAEIFPALILAGKLQEVPALKRRLLALARQHCPPTYEKLLQRPIYVKRESDTKEAIRQWVKNAQLPDGELEELLSLC
ncbi:MAG TPA: leucine-rich repeat domain-containing protein [Saprospiraceae bacterium]|nr:leucine-rich repeat domain-containing protein [Saprospiraceae bacterium]